MNENLLFTSIQNVSFSFLSNLVYSIPKEIETDYLSYLKSWEKKLTFDSVRAKPHRIYFKEQIVHIEAIPFLYSQTRALQDCLSQPQFSSLIGFDKEITSSSLTIAIISNEGKISLILRSQNVKKYPSLWSIGLGEGLEQKDFENGKISSSIMRGLNEELNITCDTSLMKCLSSCLNLTDGGFNILTIVDLRNQGESYSSENIIQQSLLAEDHWEHEKIMFINPTLEEFSHYTHYIVTPGTLSYFQSIIDYLNN